MSEREYPSAMPDNALLHGKYTTNMHMVKNRTPFLDYWFTIHTLVLYFSLIVCYKIGLLTLAKVLITLRRSSPASPDPEYVLSEC